MGKLQLSYEPDCHICQLREGILSPPWVVCRRALGVGSCQLVSTTITTSFYVLVPTAIRRASATQVWAKDSEALAALHCFLNRAEFMVMGAHKLVCRFLVLLNGGD